MKTFEMVSVGDVISLDEDECLMFKNSLPGEYVVEEARGQGDWFVLARKLGEDGCFCSSNPTIYFHQCSGYINSLISPKIVRHMTRIFV